MTEEKKKFDDGGPAYPSETFQDTEGMSLWDFYAAHAACGMFAYGTAGEFYSPDAIPRFAAEFADAMIAEKRKRERVE